MYQTCPKCGYRRKESDEAPEDRCPKCGIVFEKWLHMQLKPLPAVDSAPDASKRFAVVRTGAWNWVKSRLFHVEPDVDAVTVYGRLAVLAVAIAWGMKFILADFRAVVDGKPATADFIMDRVNLVFHEAGHLIFMPFGETLSLLGGTVVQLLIPLLAVLFMLLRYRNPFGACIGLWWLGQSTINAATYIADAQAKELVLLGGITGQDAPAHHDWANFLGSRGWLAYDQQIALGVNVAGEALMVASFAWGAAIVWMQLKRLRL